MMFPDTSNDQQLAALRRTAERYRAAGNTRSEYVRTTWKPLPPKREEMNSAGAYGLVRYDSVTKDLSLSSR
jgi:uncharacterized protein (DUF39 family)